MPNTDNARYVVLEPDKHDGAYMIILSDYNFWVTHWDELFEWCIEYDAKVDGSVVEFTDDESYILFKLRWG